jgi:hypothetical protein
VIVVRILRSERIDEVRLNSYEHRDLICHLPAFGELALITKAE